MTKGCGLKDVLGQEMLDQVQESYLRYLESSAAIYEANGEYASALFSSRYCDFLNRASRKLAGATDEEALGSGRWICHEDCWATSLKSITDKRPCEVECSGGIRIYAAPILVEGEAIGSNNAGVSNPPTDEERIREIAKTYAVDPKELLEIAREYAPRPGMVFDAARDQIRVTAVTIATAYQWKTAQESAARSAGEWQETFDAIADIVFILDRDHTIRRVNKVFLNAFGLKRDDVVGKKCYELVHKSDRAWRICPHVKTLQDHEPHTEEVDDPVLGIPLLVSTSPIRNERGDVIGTVHIAKDITELRKMRQELERKVSDLERFQAVTVGREKRVIELKEEITKLKERLAGQKPKVVGS